MISAFRVFAQTIDLNSAVEVGLVIGSSASTTPIGSASADVAGPWIAVAMDGTAVLVRRRDHRTVARWVEDSCLQPAVAPGQHLLRSSMTSIVVVGPQLVEQRVGSALGHRAEQLRE